MRRGRRSAHRTARGVATAGVSDRAATVPAMAKSSAGAPYQCARMRLAHHEVVRALRRVPGLGHGRRRPRSRRRPGPRLAAGGAGRRRLAAAARLCRITRGGRQRGERPAYRPRRAGPGAGRRAGARRGRAAGRGAGGGQVHAAAGGRRARRRGRAGAVRHRRGVGGPGAAARGPDRRGRPTTSSSPPRPNWPRCSAHVEAVQPQLLIVDSVQTITADGVDGHPGRGDPDPGGHRGPDGGGQAAGADHGAGRPRHQGRLDRRARAPWSTWSTWCCTSRATGTRSCGWSGR